MITLDLSILNQKGTPMFYSDIFANRPVFGIVGRIFISIDTAAIYRDTGTAWDLIADGGSASTNIYNSNGTLSANRVVSDGGFGLSFTPTTHIGTAAIGGGGSGKLIVGSSTADNGIQVFGANSPSIRIDNAQSGGTQRFVFGLATATNNFIQGATAGQFCISTQSAGEMLFGMWQTTNASEVMRITTANNLIVGSSVDNGNRFQVTGSGFFSNAIGISTSSPTAKLHSFGGNSNNTLPNNVQGIFENDNNGGIAISTPVGNAAGVYFPYSTDAYYAGLERNSTSLSFRSGGSIKMTLNTTGDLGIGITTPLSTLHLQKSGQNNILSIIGENGYEGALFLSGQGSGKDTNIVYGGGRDLQFFSSSSLTPVVDGTLCMSLTATGNLLVGTSVDNSYRLNVNGGGYFNGSFRIDGQTSGSAGGSSGQHLIINCDGTTYKIALLNN